MKRRERTERQKVTDWAKARAGKTGLPWQVYAGGKAPSKIKAGLVAVKKEVKRLLDMMDKRYKTAIKKGVPVSEALPLDRGYWGRVSEITTAEEGINQIRQMTVTLVEKGTGAQMAKRLNAKRVRQLEGLKRNGRVPKDWDMPKFERFLQFLEKRGAKLTAEMYYKMLMLWNEVEYGTVDEETKKLWDMGGWDALMEDFDETYARMEEFTFKRDYMGGSRGVSLDVLDDVVNGGSRNRRVGAGNSGKARGRKKKK